MSEPAKLQPGAQEPDEVPMRKLLLFAFGTIVLFGGGIAVAAAALGGRRLGTVPAPTSTVQHSLIAVGAPGLERAPAVGLDRFGWADRDAGIAIVPIDDGIDLALKERR